MTDHFNEFEKVLNKMGRQYDLAKVFNDLLTMTICTFNRTNIQSKLQEQHPESETLYLETIKPYDREHLESFGQALATLQLNVFDNPYSDILGEYFMNEITKGQNGQYFTPGHVCDMMAMLQGSPKEEGNRVLDPACGSGRMLLSYANLNHCNYFFGADNSNICAKMATINLFLNGMNGEVAWMNSLSMEWYGGWHINTDGLGILPIEKEQSLIWTKAPEAKSIEFRTNSSKAISEPAQQLTLF